MLAAAVVHFLSTIHKVGVGGDKQSSLRRRFLCLHASICDICKKFCSVHIALYSMHIAFYWIYIARWRIMAPSCPSHFYMYTEDYSLTLSEICPVIPSIYLLRYFNFFPCISSAFPYTFANLRLPTARFYTSYMACSQTTYNLKNQFSLYVHSGLFARLHEALKRKTLGLQPQKVELMRDSLICLLACRGSACLYTI